jgi:uncharacterized protein DUF2568
VSLLRGANLAVRFLLVELGALAATGYWGYETGSGAVRILLAVGAPALVVVTWALFVSPKRKHDLAKPVRFAIELFVLGAAALALWDAVDPGLGIAFAALALVSGALNYVWS